MPINIQNLFTSKSAYRHYFRGRAFPTRGWPWYKGDLITAASKEGVGGSDTVIIQDATGQKWSINEITVGAWIGRLDRTGVPIYEDDIIKIQGKPYVVSWSNTNCGFYLKDPNYGMDLPMPMHVNSVTVAGNIFDNPNELVWETPSTSGTGSHLIVE